MGIEFWPHTHAVAAAFVLPGIGSAWFTRIEAAFGGWQEGAGPQLRLSASPSLCCGFRFCLVFPFLGRLFRTISASCGSGHFRVGPVDKPDPAMWRHFESFHIVIEPDIYVNVLSRQGLILAAGRVLFGNPWIRRSRRDRHSCVRPVC